MIYFYAILFLSVILRLILVNSGYHIDMFSNADWGKWIFTNGSKDFYQNFYGSYSGPTQPPLTNLIYGFAFFLYQQLNTLFTNIAYFIAIHRLAPTKFLWWFDFVKWFGTTFYPYSFFPMGYLISLKLLGIVSDLLLGICIFTIGYKRNIKTALICSSLYLFSPFSWYISTIWGQIDGLSYLFLLLSLICLSIGKKWLILAPLFLVISFSLKPTSLIFIPLFIFIYVKTKPKIIELTLSLLLIIGFVFITVRPFTDDYIYHFIRHDLHRIIFYKSEFRVSTNSFNFWHILIGNNALGDSTPFLFISAKIWGIIAFILFNFFGFKALRRINIENIFIAVSIIGLGGWMFLTNMLERYIFAGIVSLLVVAFFRRKLIKYWIILSTIFWLNLYHGWWFPENFDLLHKILTWQGGFLTRVLSLINLIVFVKILSELNIINLKVLQNKFKLLNFKHE